MSLRTLVSTFALIFTQVVQVPLSHQRIGYAQLVWRNRAYFAIAFGAAAIIWLCWQQVSVYAMRFLRVNRGEARPSECIDFGLNKPDVGRVATWRIVTDKVIQIWYVFVPSFGHWANSPSIKDAVNEFVASLDICSAVTALNVKPLPLLASALGDDNSRKNSGNFSNGKVIDCQVFCGWHGLKLVLSERVWAIGIHRSGGSTIIQESV